MLDELDILRKLLEKSEKNGDKICVDMEIFDILLKIIGKAVANIDTGEIALSREILSDLGEELYQKMKSLTDQ